MDRYLSVREVMECTGLGKRLPVPERALNERLAKGGTRKKDEGIAG